MELQDLVSEFVSKLIAAVEADLRRRLMVAVSASFGTSQEVEKKRRPKQFCLVPGCQGVGAPTFGMVCREHKGIAKTKIAKFRKARMAERELSLKYEDGHWHADEVVAKKPRKSRATQYCPVPGCKGVAAPIFGMVCRDHKTMAKSKIAKYRKDRKAAQSGNAAKPSKVVKRKDKPSAKKVAKPMDKKAAKSVVKKGRITVEKSPAKKPAKKPAKTLANKPAKTPAKKLVKKTVKPVAKKAVTESVFADQATV